MAGPGLMGCGVEDGVFCGYGAFLAACVSRFGVLNGPRGCGAAGWPGLGRTGLRRWLLGSAQQPSHCSTDPSPSPLARVVGAPRKMPLTHLVACLRPLLLRPSSCWHLWGGTGSAGPGAAGGQGSMGSRQGGAGNKVCLG